MPPAERPPGHLLGALLHFGRLLRGLGLSASTGQIADLARALAWIDIARRDDFYSAARCLFVHSPDERALFDRAFDLFWAGQQEWLLEFSMTRAGRAPIQPDALPPGEEAAPGADLTPSPEAGSDQPEPPETRATATYSAAEVLRQRDFSDFSEEDLEAARRFIHGLIWRLDPRLTRRRVRSPKRGDALDLPRAVRQSLRHSGELVSLPWRRRKRKPRPLVVICDISGSMERYSRLLLDFLYALVQDSRQIEAFVFGTRLTRLTPALRRGSVAACLREVGDLVLDWSGGTRIGESLRTFNYTWSRRVLGRGAVAIIISDGWDRGEIALLEAEIARLGRSVSRLIWLNPLLGSPDYEPLVRGIQAVLPYVDDFLPLHNLASLQDLASRLGELSAAPPDRLRR